MERNIILSKDSNSEDIKRYFEAILKLAESGEEFPIDIDEIWMLVYAERSVAVRSLKKNFIEGVDFILLDQNVKQNSLQGSGGANKIDYKLTLSCMEYFIARKVRPVFEVYRLVFHKTAKEAQKKLSHAEFILHLAQMNVENERRMCELEQKHDVLEAKVDEITLRTNTEIKESTIVGFATRHHISLNCKAASALGIRASNICKKRGHETGKVNDPRFGFVKTYPDSVLREVFIQKYPNVHF